MTPKIVKIHPITTLNGSLFYKPVEIPYKAIYNQIEAQSTAQGADLFDDDDLRHTIKLLTKKN